MNTTTRSRLLEWRPLRKNTLRGFAKVQFPSGVIIAEVGIHVAGSRTGPRRLRDRGSKTTRLCSMKPASRTGSR
jgi:hypothetical protein